MKQVVIFLILVLALVGANARAQVTATLDVQPRTFTTPQTLTITWASTGATGCTASGAWTGAKAVTGTQQLAGVVGSSTFNLSCAGSTGPVTLTWANPTHNEDGSPYADAKNILVYRASTQAGLDTATPIAIPSNLQTLQFTGLPIATHWFGVKALNLSDIQSNFSNKVSKAVTAPSVVATPVTVTGSTKPNAPTVVTAVTAYDVKGGSGKLGDRVGVVALGTPCIGAQPIVRPNYFEVERADVMLNPGANPRPGPLVAVCGIGG